MEENKGGDYCESCGDNFEDDDLSSCKICGQLVCLDCADSFDCDSYCEDCFEEFKFSIGKY